MGQGKREFPRGEDPVKTGSHSDKTRWEILSKEIIFKIFSSLLNYNSHIVLKVHNKII